MRSTRKSWISSSPAMMTKPWPFCTSLSWPTRSTHLFSKPPAPKASNPSSPTTSAQNNLFNICAVLSELEKNPKDVWALADLNLNYKDILKSPTSCDFGEGTMTILRKMSVEKTLRLWSAFRDSIIETPQYLQNHLPLKRLIIKICASSVQAKGRSQWQ